MTADTPSDEAAPPDPTLSRLSAALGTLPKRGPPPVETWNPPYCGAIDMRIAADGTWFHNGSPIRRSALVKLFASILRREPDGRTVLVTPVESVGITVDDAPFVAVEMAVEGTGEARHIAFRTNVDDLVPLGAAHALRFEQDEAGGLRPYIHVRRDLWALLTRALTYDLVALGEERVIDGVRWFGLAAAGSFHPIAPAEAA
ncbi:DUF1285 domain-containing protein [Methylobacterium oxalidis]|uniref:Proteophosphoglycan n=1 Tax=Methylobacterium oxalidis TaxID=944322 RepID=A0A512IW96_9HYPH|nr:DUF1285 domain-containing protein [Methylobacterium oxalidis]GEP01987.1 hypothetical protein MOX02_00250 [Methylobacterium oxalidis]GLS61932.1 hypothetical protein GCM10007888_03130 [Methylobacterium oxalidis]